ncbi:MAG: hypothetical protein IKY64_03445 [Bacteroidaceae bacterium]|nr:hypothetical protein [Bacteroidaceae bacterium]
MRLYRHIAYPIVALIALLGMASCSSEDCSINNTVRGKMAFYNAYGDAVSLNAILSVSVVRPQGDSVVLNQKTMATDVTFPLSYTHETDTFIYCFDFNGNWVAYDTLYISHTNTPTLVSVDCGTAMFHTITEARSTHTLIDTLIIKSHEINYDERENIQVIYRTND